MKTYKGLQHPEQCWYPLVPGYETAGIVVAAGPQTDGKLKVGDRVMINECRQYALPGAVALNIRSRILIP